MRTAITLGITDKGKAEIISHPDVSIHDQRRAFNELGRKKGKSNFVEVQLWESGRGMQRRNRFVADAEGGVNFNAAHPVEKQQAKGKNKEKLPDLTPTFGEKGGVNFDAAKPVEDQVKKSKAKKSKAKKSAKKTPKARKTAANKASAPSAPSAPASSEKPADDSGPTL